MGLEWRRNGKKEEGESEGGREGEREGVLWVKAEWQMSKKS